MELFLYYIWQLLSMKKLKVLLTFIIAWLSWLVWWFDAPIWALLVLIITDYVMGFICAWRAWKIDKKKMKDWIWKFILYCVAVFTGNMLDVSIWNTKGIVSFHDTIAIYLIVNEALSILKHLSKCGVKLPTLLISKLEEYKETMEDQRSWKDRRKNP